MTLKQREVRALVEVWATEARKARAKRFQERGFVHVTGLSTWSPMADRQYEIQADRRYFGHTDSNNGVTVVITDDGEVWIASGRAYDKGWGERGTFVPCSNGEQLPMHDLLARVADPYDDLFGEHSPVPHSCA